MRTPPDGAPTSATEARQAVERATGNLAASYRRWPRVRSVVAGLAELEEVNHFGEKLEDLYRERR